LHGRYSHHQTVIGLRRKAMGLLAGAALLVAFVAAGAEALMGKRKFR
jgi:hypothetical protein